MKPGRTPVHTLGWAIFLGASWTWCIGMYLPVLMVRDYGIAGWIVFAIPNVIGAAAMGWVIPNAQASRDFVRRHRVACECFSIVTLAFHIFFYFGWIYYWFGHRVRPENLAILLAVMTVMVGFWRFGDRLAAAGVFGVSCVIAVKLWLIGAIPHLPQHSMIQVSKDILFIAPVSAFGFALCPYLDLTFHRARQDLGPAQGRAAFAIGFGVFFFAMILFTLAYAYCAGVSDWLYGVSAGAAVLLGFHFLTQTALKLVLHTRELLSGRVSVVLWAAAIIAAILFGSACKRDGWFVQPQSMMSLGEIIYRCFMSFYGLVFPAYVWICIIGQRRWPAWAIAVAIAGPMYWLAFIDRQMIWLLPALAVVLLGNARRPRMVGPS